jgi:hypothetical protein
MALVLGAFFIAVFPLACVLVAFRVGGREINGALVVIAILAAGTSVFSLVKLRDTARTDGGWGMTFVSYAVAYISLLLFLVAAALNHQMG